MPQWCQDGEQEDNMGHGRSAAKGEICGTHRKIPNVPWTAWPLGLVETEAQCLRGEKSSQDSCGTSQGSLQFFLSRQDLLTVYKWKPGKHKLLSQFWAGRRLAEAACAVAMPVVCGEWSGCVCTDVDAALGLYILSLSKLSSQGQDCERGALQKGLPTAPMTKMTFKDSISLLF